MSPTPFALLLRTYREARGLSKQALARRVGVDPSYVSMLESGRRDVPPPRMLHRLLDCLGLDGPDRERCILAAHGIPEAEQWAQQEIHAATVRAANALLAACPCVRCRAQGTEATA